MYLVGELIDCSHSSLEFFQGILNAYSADFNPSPPVSSLAFLVNSNFKFVKDKGELVL